MLIRKAILIVGRNGESRTGRNIIFHNGYGIERNALNLWGLSMGIKSRSNYSTSLTKCFDTCKCPQCRKNKQVKRKEKQEMRNKGEVVTSLTAMIVLLVASVGSMGSLYGGGGPGAIIGSSLFLTSATGAALATNLDASVDPFRKNRAIEICEYNGETDCQELVSIMTKDEIIDYIKDDSAYGTGFYSPVVSVKNGGNLRARILKAQK